MINISIRNTFDKILHLLWKIHCDMKLSIFDFLCYITFVGVWKCFYVENGFSINFAKSCYGHLGTSFSLFAQSSFILHSTCVVNKFLLNFRFVWTRQYEMLGLDICSTSAIVLKWLYIWQHVIPQHCLLTWYKKVISPKSLWVLNI